jgi:pimeloyl-ACP methyl ester carboxylesterase
LISQARSLVTHVWIPEAGPSQRPRGGWPLIVFAHGFEVGPGPYAALLAAWAAHGYVIAAPEFPLTDASVAGSNLDEADITNQPADVRFVTDYLVSARSPVGRLLNPDEVAVAGHSDGAETALAAAFAPSLAGQPVYRAVVVFGVQPVPGAAGKNPPILVGQGDEDQINPPSYGYSTFEQAAPPRYLMVIRGGGHLPPLESGSPWLNGIEAYTEAFFDAYVARDAPASSITALAPRYPNLSLETG